MVMAAATRTRLLLALVAVVALAGVRAQQSDPSESPPTESQCRPYIEKALKEFGTSEQTPGGKEEDVDQPTTEKYTQPLGHETISPDEENIGDQIISEDDKEQIKRDASSEDTITEEEVSEEVHGDESEVTEPTTESAEAGTDSIEDGTDDETVTTEEGDTSTEQDTRDSQEGKDASERGATSAEDSTTSIEEGAEEVTSTEGTSPEEGGVSAEDGTASAEEGAASTEGAASAEEGAASAEEGAEEGVASAEEGAASAEEGAASAEEGAASAEEGAASAEEGAASAEEGAASAEEGAASAEEGAASAEEGAASAEEGAASAEEGAASAEEGAASAEEGAASAEEGAASAEEGAASAEEGAASAEEGAASAEEGAASAEEGAASAEEGAASAEEGAGSAEGASTEEKTVSTASTEENVASGEEVPASEGEGTEEGVASAEEGTASTQQRSTSDEGAVSAEEGAPSAEDVVSREEEIVSIEEVITTAASAEEDGKPTEESREGSKSAEVEEQELEDVSNITSAEQAADDVASVSEEKETEGEVESQETRETTPEEELTQELIIPENLRPRDHIAQILHLDQESIEKELLLSKTVEITLKELKRLYDTAIKPLELLYKYRDLSNRHFGDPEIFSKPLILFMGPWSGGKSSIINYLLDNEYAATALRTGAEPSPAYFNILMWGDHPEVIDGTQLAADWTFSGLQKFGQGLLDRLRGLRLPNRLLEKVNIVEIPGILEIRKQVERLFPFNDACQWFIDRADIIFLVYDPAKLDVGPETEAILDQLKGRESQTRIVLNKADQVRPEELMRVQGTLIWNISPLMSSTEPPVMYSTSLWSLPYEIGAPIRLLQAQERAFLRDMRTAIDRRVENKIASARRFAVRVRNHAKMVDCYLTTYYNHKGIFGNRKRVSDDIIERPQDYHIYEGLSTLTNISRYDLPDPDVYKDFFRLNPLYEFPLLSSTCTYFRGCPINRLDIAIAYDLPELVGKYRKGAEEALASKS